MQYLLILFACTIATAKMMTHRQFGKNNVKTLADAALFYFGIFLVSSLLFCYRMPSATVECWLYATLFGLFSTVFQLFYTRALATGPISLVGLLINLAMLIPVLFSAIAYREPISPLCAVGILLILVSFALCVERGSGKRHAGKEWIFYAIVTMLANGACSVVQKIYVKTDAAASGQVFTACCYLAAAVLCLAYYLIARSHGVRASYPIGRSFFGYVLAVGLLLGAFQAVNTYAVSKIPGTLFFPAYYGTAIIIAMLAGVLVCKDKLKPRQLVAILVGVVAVVLVNL